MGNKLADKEAKDAVSTYLLNITLYHMSISMSESCDEMTSETNNCAEICTNRVSTHLDVYIVLIDVLDVHIFLRQSY